jgi:hypothetical protein
MFVRRASVHIHPSFRLAAGVMRASGAGPRTLADPPFCVASDL